MRQPLCLLLPSDPFCSIHILHSVRHCCISAPQVPSKSHQVYLLSCISRGCCSSISSTSRVHNLTRRTIFQSSFTFAEYLICFSRKASISSEHRDETNCFKSAEPSHKVWPSGAPSNVEEDMRTGCTLSMTLVS